MPEVAEAEAVAVEIVVEAVVVGTGVVEAAEAAVGKCQK
jgi:hypothetical protein